MKLKQLHTDDDAVSPVIGVILMVAITVILAAVIGTFVLGLGDQVQNSAPQANFAFDYEDDGASNYQVEVIHEGGQQLSDDNAQKVLVSGGSPSDVNWLDAASGLIQAGDSCVYAAGNAPCGDGSSYNLNSGEDVRVVWYAESGNSQTIGQSTVPS